MTGSRDTPSAWVRQYATGIAAGGSILDVACGSGRHSYYFSERGYHVTAVDRDVGRLHSPDRDTVEHAHPLEIITADLETEPWPFTDRVFDGIVVTDYLHRPHFPLLAAALAPGGMLLFDTFAAGNQRFGRPRNPAFLLQPGELLDAFSATLQIVAYEHGEVATPRPAMRQRLCAIKSGPALATAGPVSLAPG